MIQKYEKFSCSCHNAVVTRARVVGKRAGRDALFSTEHKIGSSNRSHVDMIWYRRKPAVNKNVLITLERFNSFFTSYGGMILLADFT